MEKALEALLHGQGYANQLKNSLNHPIPNSDNLNLAQTVLFSFSTALSLLTSSSSPPTTKRNREMGEVSSMIKDSPFPNYPDGFLWRKYGQKNIKTSPHQRSYYRCSYTKECNAKKQVQKIQDNPPLYQIIYMGTHTCHHHDQTADAFQVMSESVQDEFDNARMIRFDMFDPGIKPAFKLTGPVNDHQEIIIKDDQMNQDWFCDELFADDVQFWPSDLSPSSSSGGDTMIGSSSFLETAPKLDMSEYDDFELEL